MLHVVDVHQKPVGARVHPLLLLCEDSLLEEAVALGCAVQLLNIIRDTREDLLRRGRIYFPLADAARVGLSEADLEAIIRSGSPTPQYRP